MDRTISFLDGRLTVSLDITKRGVGLGLSFWFGELTLQAALELPFALVTVSYAR